MKIICITFLVFTLFSLNACGQKGHTNSNQDKINGDTLIHLFTQTDFFNLTDSEYLDSARDYLKDYYESYDYFGGYTYPDSLRYVDYRFYFIDSEELFELGGLTEYLDLVKPTFDKLGLKLEYKNEQNISDEYHWKHTIEVNNKEYIAFDGKLESFDLWDKAYLNFIELLNDQLVLQGSNELFYPIRSDNDGMIVMLTKNQFDIVKKYYPNDNEHPKKIDNWVEYE